MPLHVIRKITGGDTLATALMGTVGNLLTVLDEGLILGRLFTTPDDAAWTDRSAEARLDTGTAFVLFQTPATGDRAYFGMPIKFSQLIFDLDTLGAGGTYVWEYWNGSSWATLTVTDGTSGFTVDGIVSWTPPGAWASSTINSVAFFWVRVRPSGVPTTNPTVFSCSTLGWLRAFEGTNKAAYKQAAKSGFPRFFLRVDDSGPGVGSYRQTRNRGYEAMTDVDTGTGDFPTVAQNQPVFTKSTTLDSAARSYVLIADGRTFHLYDQYAVTTYWPSDMYFGDIESFLTGDQYGCAYVGEMGGESAAPNITQPLLGALQLAISNQNGWYLARSYTGIGTAIAIGGHCDYVKGGQIGMFGHLGLNYPNPTDGRLFLSPCWVHEGATVTVRGKLRGLWSTLHSRANFNDQDTFSGVGEVAGRTFLQLKNYNSTQSGGMFTLETSDTWPATS